MRNYKVVNHVVFDHRSNTDDKFKRTIAETVKENQNNGYQSEIQYSTCATDNTVVYSALILAYTEE